MERGSEEPGPVPLTECVCMFTVYGQRQVFAAFLVYIFVLLPPLVYPNDIKSGREGGREGGGEEEVGVGMV